ncbi:MAG: MFS transporter [Bacteroidetes bacterium]|nr:MFS transporter [Bacteroidota bacterium]
MNSKNSPKVYPYRYIILAIFMLLSLVIQIQWLTHAAVARPANEFYQGQFNPNSFFNIDFLAMSYMVIYILISFPASYIIDTYGIKIGLSIGAVLTGIFALLKGIFAASFLMVVIAQIGLAIAQPFILNAITAVTVRWFPLRERALAAGMAALSQYLGIIIAMLVTPMLIGSDPALPDYGQGFEKMLMFYGLISVLAAVLVLAFIREHPPTPPSGEVYKRLSFRKGFALMLKNRNMLITIFLFFIGLGIFNAISSLTDALAENSGVADSDGLIGGLMLIGGIIGAVIIPLLSDKLRKRKLFLVICMAGMVPGVFGLAFADQIASNADSIYTISMISSFILGFFVMSAGPIGFQYAAEVSYPAPESASQSILLWVGQITGMVFVAGMSMKENAYLGDFMTIFAGLSILALIGVLFLKESPLIESGVGNPRLTSGQAGIGSRGEEGTEGMGMEGT